MGRARGANNAGVYVRDSNSRFDAVFGARRTTRPSSHIGAVADALDACDIDAALTNYLKTAQTAGDELDDGRLGWGQVREQMVDMLYADIVEGFGGDKPLHRLVRDLGNADNSADVVAGKVARTLDIAKEWSNSELQMSDVIVPATTATIRRYLRGPGGLLSGLGFVLGDSYAGRDGVHRVAQATGEHWDYIEHWAQERGHEAGDLIADLDARDWSMYLRNMQDHHGNFISGGLPPGAELIPASGPEALEHFQRAIADSTLEALSWRLSA